ncbi:MAG: sigma-70 family RNA polymerase sigma factor [Bacteroidota bacterium]
MPTSLSQEQQFTHLLESHKKLVFKIANAYCSDREERKDLIQEIVLQLWKAFPRYDSRYAVSTWMYRIALNVAISYYRKESRRKSKTVHPKEAIIDLAEDDQERLAEKESRIGQLYQWINQLGELDKALMILYLEGKSHQEIAEILGISKSNVGTKISRNKRKLTHHFHNIQQ